MRVFGNYSNRTKVGETKKFVPKEKKKKILYLKITNGIENRIEEANEEMYCFCNLIEKNIRLHKRNS